MAILFFKEEVTMSISQILHNKFMSVFETFTGAFKTMDNDHAYIHQKLMFSAYSKISVLTGGNYAFAFKTPSIGYVHYRLAGINPSADKVETFIYEDAVFIPETGTLLVSTNRNRNDPIVSTVELRSAPTFTDNGTLLPGLSSYLPGSAGVGQTRVGTSGQSASEIVLKQNTTYRFYLTNGSSTTNDIGINFMWYEEEGGE